MATYIDALNGDHTDGREQFSHMDNAMADIQADDVKHYDDLPHLIAQKLLETVSQDDLEDCYYEMQKEWAESLSESELLEIARDLNVEI